VPLRQRRRNWKTCRAQSLPRASGRCCWGTHKKQWESLHFPRQLAVEKSGQRSRNPMKGPGARSHQVVKMDADADGERDACVKLCSSWLTRIELLAPRASSGAISGWPPKRITPLNWRALDTAIRPDKLSLGHKRPEQSNICQHFLE